ncbi:putative TPR Domain containing protein [Neospora caninum Liverpool]|uniref:Putative TPR Domain containing protein n=1 Tax=Neospora caninum (strain Liverpool) TaxID=572307 RepID=F0VE17_NEOCL|nr:putative TPR Domain containing protein [Neospora caninum Liverpool]CBZ51960.1 putative TPR Domain containing protein [Neospora caninum Liverpool]|eukprot:XP_003881993.1 putative TPR Domain containing protein [Neospora caninum Liverpool]
MIGSVITGLFLSARKDITSPSEKSYEVEGWIELRRQRPFRSCDHGSGPAIWVSGEAQHAFDVKERAGASHATLKCEELFERAYDKGVLASDKRIPAPSTLMGKTTVQILNNFWSGAQDTLQEALRHYPWFWPASVCKSELLVLLSRWDEAAQCARNLLRIDEDDLDSHTVLLLHAVAQKGDLDQGVLQVRTFFEMLAVQEPYSFALWLDSARLFLSMVGIHDDATEAILSFLRENNVADCQEQLDRANAQHKKRERLSPYHSLLLSTSKVRAGLKVDVADENVFVNLQEAMAHVDEAVSYTVRDFRSTFGLYFFTAFRANLLFDAASTYLDLACYGSLIKTLKPSTGNSVVELSVGFLTTATPSKDTSFVAEALAKASSVLGTLCHFMPGHGMAKAMMARVHLLQGDTEAARRTLRDALSSRAFSDDLGGTKSSIAAHFCLMLARLEQLAGQPAEGLAQLEKALSFDLHLKSTLPYYLIKADLHLQKTEFDEAVSTLEESQKLATPTPENFTAIGEALLEVYEPRGAVEAFERALHAKPGDRKLIRRIVAALVKTHQYERASTYASNSLREQPEDLELRLDLVALLFRLRRWQEAIETASVVDGDNTAYDGSFSLGAKVQILLLKVKALLSQTSSYSARGDEAELEDSALRTLHRCRVAIKRYLELHQRSAESASGEGAWRISRLGADVYCQLGAILERRKGEAEQAAQCFEEARELDSERTSALLALSRIRLRQGHLQAAEEYLSALQRLDPTNEGVSLIKSEIVAAALLDNVRHSPCDLVSHCFSLLRLHLPHFKALGDALALMRKQGLLIENYSTIITAIENLKQSTGSLYIEAGTNYCLGIIKRWRHFPHEALQHLNVARRHSSFYHDSMRHMVEICLDPGDRITVEALLANDADQHTLSSAPKAHATNAFEAERLLQEWHAAGPPVEMRRRLMTWQIEALAFSKDRGKMDLALKAVGDLLLQHRDDVPLLLAAAETLLVMRQTSKARVHLKRIYELAKVGIDPIAEAETERASLLLAELHIQAGKTDNAIPLITLVTNRNKECARAWELLGMCAEKRGQYEQSADHYGKVKGSLIS